MSSKPEAVAAEAKPLRLTFATGRRGGSVGVEQPLPEILLGLAGAEQREQHERLVAGRRETADTLHQLDARTPAVKKADEDALRKSLRTGSKTPPAKLPAVEEAAAALRARLDSYDLVLRESAQELLASIAEAGIASAWEQARQDELAILAGLPERCRELVADLDQAGALRAQRGWLGSLLATRSAAPFAGGHGGRGGREEQQTRGDLSVAAQRLERIAAGVEEAGLVIDGAEWRFDTAYVDGPAAKAPAERGTK